MINASAITSRIMQANQPKHMPVLVRDVRETDSGGLCFTVANLHRRGSANWQRKFFLPAIMTSALNSGSPNKALDSKLKL